MRLQVASFKIVSDLLVVKKWTWTSRDDAQRRARNVTTQRLTMQTLPRPASRIFHPTSRSVDGVFAGIYYCGVMPISLVGDEVDGEEEGSDSLDSGGFQRGRHVSRRVHAENWFNTFNEVYCYFIGIVTVQKLLHHARPKVNYEIPAYSMR